MVSLGFRKLVDQTSNRPSNSEHDLVLMQVWLWKCFGASSQSKLWAGHCWLLYKIHFLSRHNLIEKFLFIAAYNKRWWRFKTTIFLIYSRLMKHPLTEIFHLSNLLQMPKTIEWSKLSSSTVSHVVVKRTSFDDCFQLVVVNWDQLMAGHSTPHLQGSHHLEPPLHCTFVSSSWSKCIVVSSCLCCFAIHFELIKLLRIDFCLKRHFHSLK